MALATYEQISCIIIHAMSSPEQPSSSPALPQLIGREEPLRLLRSELALAQKGQGRVCCIAGEAGIGKSRLVTEALSLQQTDGTRVLRGNCFEFDRNLPYAPILDLLRRFNASHSSAEITEAFAPTANELAQLLPELKTLLPILSPAPALEPGQEKRQLFEALAQCLIELCRRTSLHTILLEDLHWCDDISLEFLQFFVHRIGTHPLLLVLTYRSNEARDSLQHCLAVLERTRLVTTINLLPLQASDTQQLLLSTLTHAPIQRELSDAIHELTDGNPFFIEEMMKSLVGSGDIFRVQRGWMRTQLSEWRIPITVQDAVQQRAQQLSAEAQHVLRLAAVMGRRFDFEVLLDITQNDEATLLAHIKQLIAAQLVIEQDEQFAFRHALTRQAIYTQMLVRERRPLHRAIAAAIEQRYSAQLDVYVADLALHYFEAGEWTKACDCARRAGERAQALFSPRAAVEHFTRAIEAAEHLALRLPLHKGEAKPSADLSPLHHQRGQMHEALGNFELARADYESAHAHARDKRDEWQATLSLGFLWNARDYTKAETYLRRALELARQLDDLSTLAHSLNRAGNLLVNLDRQWDALPYHQEALMIFQLLNDPRGKAMTHDLLGANYFMMGDLLASMKHYEQAIQICRTLNDRSRLLLPLSIHLMRCGCYTADLMVATPVSLDECKRDVAEVLQLTRQIGTRSDEAAVRSYCALVLGARGQYAAGLTFANESLMIATESAHTLWISLSNMTLGALYTDLLAFELARPHLQRALDMARKVNVYLYAALTASFLVPVLTALNEHASASSLLSELLRPAAPLQSEMVRRLWTARAELELAQGQAETALATLGQVLRVTPHLTSPPIPLLLGEERRGEVVPRLWRLRGEALTALARRSEAEAVLRDGLRVAIELDTPPQVWRLHIALGKLYRSMRKPEQAAAEFDAAKRLIAQLANDLPTAPTNLRALRVLRTQFAQRAQALMPTTPLTPLQQAKVKAGGLTARERSIALLIAQGQSNREIAEQLVLSPRTIEFHIGNIMNKLSVNSRVEIATWVAKHELSPDT